MLLVLPSAVRSLRPRGSALSSCSSWVSCSARPFSCGFCCPLSTFGACICHCAVLLVSIGTCSASFTRLVSQEFVLLAPLSRAVPNGGVRKTMFQLLSQFRIIVDIFIGIVAQTSLTFLEPSAQIHVTNFFPDLTPSRVGLLFMLAILCYAAMAPFAGWVSDTRFGRHPVMSCGLFLISVGLYMFGPIGWPFTVPTMGSLIGGLAVVRFALQSMPLRLACRIGT